MPIQKYKKYYNEFNLCQDKDYRHEYKHVTK